MFSGSHISVGYDGTNRRVLPKTFKMKPFVLSYFSVFLEIGCKQHAGAEYFGHHDKQYYVCFVSDDIKL